LKLYVRIKTRYHLLLVLVSGLVCIVVLLSSGNAEMVKAFISSIEYRQRFGPLGLERKY
jgi:hypothetical protein